MIEIDRKLDQVVARHGEIEALLADPAVIADQLKYRDLSREYRSLAAVVAKGGEYREVIKRIDGSRSLAAEAGDPELAELAAAELAELEPRGTALAEELKTLLVPRDPNDFKNAIIEIRGGTGGEEAALFAGDLFRMYVRYAERKGWQVDIMDSSPTQLGGYKEVVFAVQGEGAFGSFKFESGVHRVQRVPRTEASGRIHTSAATVAVLPEAEEIDLVIDPKDVRVDTFCSSGAGGQSVNTTYSAVRLTHVPSGLVVSCQDERSQIKNRAKAMTVLRSRLLEKMQSEQDARLAKDRKSQVKSGDRSEKIRTYNFPQNRLNDHRIGLTLHSLDRVLEGALDEVIGALAAAEMAEKLQAGE
ncbi:MAG: peptide chain release factor 1 [Candidatus Edwardsbacteria bacterium]|jgi:peptide chain release factor 1|nr:peptide chain release factor 1 [Candidatus Edwardsbacteria bacterium]